MAYVLVNKDGTNNAKVGDIVVTGGGLFEKTASGISKRVGDLYTSNGRSGNYADVVDAFNKLTGSSNQTTKTTTTTTTKDGTTEIYDSAENYDSYTLPLSYDYSSGSYDTSGTLSKVIGYAIVGLVLLVVADKLIGK
jgi:hypothetical protein